MPQKKKLTAEEKEELRVSREEKAVSAREAAVRRQKALRIEKKLNLYGYMEEITGISDLSIAQLKNLLSSEYIIKYENDGGEQIMRICDLIADAARSGQVRR